MKKKHFWIKKRRKLAKSLENEEWVADLTKRKRNNTRDTPAIASTNKSGSISE